MNTIKVENYFSIGIALAKKDYWTIFLNYLVYCLIAALASLTIIGVFVVPAIFVGYTRFLLRAARGEPVSVGDGLSEGFKNGLWWKSLFFFFLFLVGYFLGFMLCILPGLYLLVVWSLGFYLLVDKDMLPTDALSKSRELVHQLGFWKVAIVIFTLQIISNVIAYIPIAGLIAIFFLLPFMQMIYVAVYLSLIHI